jgi:hypothetical protein
MRSQDHLGVAPGDRINPVHRPGFVFGLEYGDDACDRGRHQLAHDADSRIAWQCATASSTATCRGGDFNTAPLKKGRPVSDGVAPLVDLAGPLGPVRDLGGKGHLCRGVSR